MCYTKTEQNGRITNPCYACHTNGKAPNYFNELNLQKEYLFPKKMMKNPYKNLFIDRQAEISSISDYEILKYISKSNYDNDLKEKYNCYFNFDKDGFDRDENGKYTLWRAFVYKPFLGTFFPTNGSVDDVIIRLPKIFAQNDNGDIDIDIYKQNLEILLHNIKNEDGIVKNYIAKASGIKTDLGLYPIGVELLHSVRYIDFNSSKLVGSNRFKELRYGVKERYMNYSELEILADEEALEEPDKDGLVSMQSYLKSKKDGFYNGLGWRYLGYIEDKKGDLRIQNDEETLSCMGCHAKLGATTDSTFSFSRQVKWGYQDIYGLDDKDGEYRQYLEQNPTGNEYGTNDEVLKKFYHTNGKKNKNSFKKLHDDITTLLVPSFKRAMKLNKAYYILVKEQSFIYGKEAVIKPMKNVFKQIDSLDTNITDIIISDYKQ